MFASTQDEKGKPDTECSAGEQTTKSGIIEKPSDFAVLRPWHASPLATPRERWIVSSLAGGILIRKARHVHGCSVFWLFCYSLPIATFRIWIDRFNKIFYRNFQILCNRIREFASPKRLLAAFHDAGLIKWSGQRADINIIPKNSMGALEALGFRLTREQETLIFAHPQA